ncbi:hypothetical protein F2Q70_00020020 [Brassica cretica]|uniref:Uncharacterized protein n=1 Tax=Brassica cretica TaxID=69181 RepID=A0A8S9GMB1_BRACR|nr:hypothetical protein F2Q70_00020020 [Brassica cretica]
MVKQGVEVSDLNQSLKEVSGLKVIEEIGEGFEKIGGSGVLEQGGGQTESVQESKDQISGGSKGSWVGAVQGHKFLKKRGEVKKSVVDEKEKEIVEKEGILQPNNVSQDQVLVSSEATEEEVLKVGEKTSPRGVINQEEGKAVRKQNG